MKIIRRYEVILVRHGQSIWNHDSKFTGWTNIPLTDLGRNEAKIISKAIKENTTKFSYKVNYGKIDKTSTESVSEGTFKDIQKLIATKEKKGYVQVE